MSSLRLAMKLSMLEAKPEDLKANKNIEDNLLSIDDSNQSRKRKASFDAKDSKNKTPSKSQTKEQPKSKQIKIDPEIPSSLSDTNKNEQVNEKSTKKVDNENSSKKHSNKSKNEIKENKNNSKDFRDSKHLQESASSKSLEKSNKDLDLKKEKGNSRKNSEDFQLLDQLKEKEKVEISKVRSETKKKGDLIVTNKLDEPSKKEMSLKVRKNVSQIIDQVVDLAVDKIDSDNKSKNPPKDLQSNEKLSNAIKSQTKSNESISTPACKEIRSEKSGKSKSEKNVNKIDESLAQTKEKKSPDLENALEVEDKKKEIDSKDIKIEKKIKTEVESSEKDQKIEHPNLNFKVEEPLSPVDKIKPNQESANDKYEESEHNLMGTLNKSSFNEEIQNDNSVKKIQSNEFEDDENVKEEPSKDSSTSSKKKKGKKSLDISNPDTAPIDKEKTENSSEQQEKQESTANADEAETPRYQTSRAAAMLAKSKLSGKKIPSSNNLANTEKTQSHKPKEKPKQTIEKQIAVPENVEWVQCERCLKWRSISPGIDPDSLPDIWYCNMNTWNDKYNNCDAPDEDLEKSNPDIINTSLKIAKPPKEEVKTPRSTPRSVKGKRNAQPQSSSNETSITDSKSSKVETGSNKKQKLGSRTGLVGKNLSSQLNSAVNDPNLAYVPTLNWVQCNKCGKWRKVPEAVDIKKLPEKWFCNLNYWDPSVAKCSAKEESVNDDKKPTLPLLKKISWVQCERKTCKKWRKVPAHIDITALPEKWYCEMNSWDKSTANCDAPEESDNEDQYATGEGRSQLIMANAKGAGSLSYRRIIFGNDGKIRPCFSEKNKNGYGIFSSSEQYREFDSDDEDGILTKRIAYWWSDAYEYSNESFSGIHRNKKSTQSSQTKFSSKHLFQNRDSPTYLLDSINRFHNQTYKSNGYIQLKKAAKYNQLLPPMPLLKRHNFECTVIRSCMATFASNFLHLDDLITCLNKCHFQNDKMEACRKSFTFDSLKAILHKLEENGEIEVFFDNKGKLSINILQSIEDFHPKLKSDVEDKWKIKGLPIKLRKLYKSIELSEKEIAAKEEEEASGRRKKSRRSAYTQENSKDKGENENNNLPEVNEIDDMTPKASTDDSNLNSKDMDVEMTDPTGLSPKTNEIDSISEKETEETKLMNEYDKKSTTPSNLPNLGNKSENLSCNSSDHQIGNSEQKEPSSPTAVLTSPSQIENVLMELEDQKLAAATN